MRLLLIHADYIEYAALKPAVKEPEAIDNVGKVERVEECLVAFCSAEKSDEQDPKEIARLASGAILEHARMVKAERVVIYPYAHLSSELASPRAALSILKALEETLRGSIEVKRSPFGWYKTFTLRCKGHPLSELSRSITLSEKVPAEEKVEKAEKVEPAPSTFLILTPDGEELPIDLSKPETFLNLKIDAPLLQLIKNEAGLKGERGAPAHIKLMKRLELVDYEPASDVGHFRFYPKGTVIKDTLEEFAYDIAVRDLKAFKIETPFLYRLDEPDIAEQASKFRERDYRLEVDKKPFTLRFAGDFGLFRMMKDVTMSYRQLPVRVYELSPSFRLEQSGECVGLKRLRSFTMPDVHCFCANLEQGLSEYRELFEKYTKLTNSMEIEYAVAFRIVKDFYSNNKGWLVSLLKIVNKPALIELLPEMKHYWVLKHEYQAIDSVGGNVQLVTVQLDVEDAARYGIFYTDENGQKKGCIILHSSLGSIERWMGAILEQAAKDQKVGKPPKLPVWLSPIQVRIIPVNSSYVNFAVNLASKLSQNSIRVDVDDRDESVAKKIREAEMEWIPYIVVVGEKEASSGELPVRVRGGGMVTATAEDLVAMVSKKIGSKPKLPSYTPLLLSLKPRFA
ncbi:MAG: threonine--tRNA ligase [Candidatus Methanomethylicia archaeon]|jgi:threonyl-tRNA synthetase|nr:threonine--tRNA ligase [Candidatus Methanomethylicia archaeon]